MEKDKNYYLEKFKNIGLNENTCKELIKNEGFSKNLSQIIDYTENNNIDKKIGNLLYSLSGKVDFMFKENIVLLSKKISNGEIERVSQIDKAIDYFKKNHKIIENNEITVLDKYLGIGVKVSIEEIENYVNNFLENNKEIIKSNGNYRDAGLMKNLKEGLEFANPKDLTKIYLEKGGEFIKSLGIDVNNKTKKKKNNKKVPNNDKEKKELKDEKLKHKMKKLLGRDLSFSLNNKENLEWHKNNYNNKILTRFPPEPNGFLHIGHCQAMNFSFEIAGVYEGNTYLRYDDTNPEKENQIYIDNIKDNVVNYMNFKPFKITYSSDYFDKLYDFALELIKKEKAFCCFLDKEKSKEYRENKIPSPYRNTTVEENLEIFEKMKKGFYKSGEVVLRAKIDYQNNENTLRDPSIYRIKYVSHPRSKDKWCIYPLYDFVHGICDSLEGITHSFCTLEFEGRRELYYWFLNELNLYKPYVWEFSRLSITYTVLSKRKINRLIELKIVEGWNDPRLFTIDGLQKRGISENYIKDFLNLVGVTRRGNDKVVQIELFESSLRNNLDNDSIRSFAIYDPVELLITNLNEPIEYDVLDYPQKKENDSKHKITLNKHIFVDLSDVKEKDEKNFYGIAPGKLVRLKYGPVIKINKVVLENNNYKIEANIENDFKGKVKGTLQWISKEESLKSKFVILEKLFKSKNPEADGGDFINNVNYESKKIKEGIINNYLLSKIKIDSKIQFERLGYFNVDSESNLDKKELNFIRIISLKVDKLIK